MKNVFQHKDLDEPRTFSHFDFYFTIFFIYKLRLSKLQCSTTMKTTVFVTFPRFFIYPLLTMIRINACSNCSTPWRHRFERSPFLPCTQKLERVQQKISTLQTHFQMYSFLSAYSAVVVRMRKRIGKYTFSNENALVWMWPINWSSLVIP